MDPEDPQINQFQLIVMPTHFFVRTKKQIRTKKLPGPDDCNRPHLGSRPGSPGASLWSRIVGNTMNYKGFCAFKGSSWTLRSRQSWAPGINGIQLIVMPIHFLFEQKNIRTENFLAHIDGIF